MDSINDEAGHQHIKLRFMELYSAKMAAANERVVGVSKKQMKKTRGADLVAESWKRAGQEDGRGAPSLGSIAPICRNGFMWWLDEHLRHPHGELLHR